VTVIRIYQPPRLRGATIVQKALSHEPDQPRHCVGTAIDCRGVQGSRAVAWQSCGSRINARYRVMVQMDQPVKDVVNLRESPSRDLMDALFRGGTCAVSRATCRRCDRSRSATGTSGASLLCLRTPLVVSLGCRDSPARYGLPGHFSALAPMNELSHSAGNSGIK
jgi:hypothetical protein